MSTPSAPASPDVLPAAVDAAQWVAEAQRRREAGESLLALWASDERDRVVECLQGLSAAQRQCIEMAYYQGLTYAQVSEQLAQNPSTIKSRMRDALRKLRRCLDVP